MSRSFSIVRRQLIEYDCSWVSQTAGEDLDALLTRDMPRYNSQVGTPQYAWSSLWLTLPLAGTFPLFNTLLHPGFIGSRDRIRRD